MSIYQDIVTWSEAELFGWQRDALRRIVQNGGCNERDIIELAFLCKKESGVPLFEDLGVSVLPIKQEDVPKQAEANAPVSLTGMGEFINVNRISEDAQLDIPETGVTVVFGNNGSGKSGYIRVLKKACRARGFDDEEVYPNIYNDNGEEPSAKITFKEGDEAKEFEWDEDEPTPASLSAINVFDSKSAQIHVTEENELLYQPFGTDLVPALIDVVDRVAVVIRREMQGAAQSVDNFAEIGSTTVAGIFVRGVTVSTTDEQIEQATTFTDVEEGQLKKARELLASIETKDPTQEIEIKNRTRASLVSLKTAMANLPVQLSKEHIVVATTQRDKNNALSIADEEAAKGFNGLEISGVGGTVWKALWESARRYSEGVAYPAIKFPNLEGKCVLCHQDYSEEAKSRMGSFEDFVKNDIQTQLAESNLLTSRSVEGYQYLRIRPVSCEAGLAALDTLNPVLKVKCEAFFDSYEERKQLIINSYTNDTGTGEIKDPADLGSDIDALVAVIDSEVEDLNKQKTGEVSKTSVQATINELDARRLAKIALPRIKAEITRRNSVIKYQVALQSVVTTRMTNKAKQLSDTLSGELANNFVAEIRKLRVHNKVDVELQPSGARKGVAYHKIVSPTANGSSVPLMDVLSEGEFRAVAIAAFMTEVNSSPSNSGIVFDDPVTSLDHERKASIAHRIIEESTKRQVIVFTHDLPFVFDLANEAKKIDVTPVYRTMYVNTGDRATGNVEDDLPWDGKSPEKRVRELRSRLQTLTAAHTKNDPSYTDQVDTFNNKLRQTWEAAVEKILLYEVVTRFDRVVQTSKVRYLVNNITPEDNQRISDAITKCGPSVHDTPEERTEPVPEPSELEADLNNLAEWINEVKARHNTG